MKRVLLPLLAAMVAMLVVAAVAGGHGSNGHRSLDLLGTEVSFNFFDADPKQANETEPATPGDSFALSETLTKHGKDFGSLYAHCTFITAEAAQCLATLDLPNGQITVQGAFVGEPTDFTFAVTGGTGDYTGAGGTIRIQDPEEEGGPSRYTIRLLR